MKSLRKSNTPSVRFTEDQRALINRAARIVTRQRGEVVAPMTLVRELAVAGAAQIVAARSAAA